MSEIDYDLDIDFWLLPHICVKVQTSSQVFVGLAPGQQELPKFVTYKIRIDADKVQLPLVDSFPA